MSIDPRAGSKPRDLSRARIDIHPPALESARTYGLDEEKIRAVARQPQLVNIDPSSATREWFTERRRSGDIVVVVTYPEGRPPLVWGVYVVTGQEPHNKRSPGGAGGTSLPTSMRDLRRRIVAAGLVIVARDNAGHDRVQDQDGKFVASLPHSPSDNRTIPNVARTIMRKGYEI